MNFRLFSRISMSVGWLALLLCTAVTASAEVRGTAVTRPHDPIHIRERHGTLVQSSNWSGYAVTGTPGSITDVKGSWIVPGIQGACGTTDSYSSFWIGIDGYSSNTVEQIGT